MLGAWDTQTVTALAAVGGSVVGALGSSVSSWIVQKHQDRRDLLTRTISHREQLYSDFINETAKAMVDAVQHTFQDPNLLIPIYALLSRIRLSSSQPVVESAERVVRNILATYSAPNLTPQQIQSHAGKRDDALREFSVTCRRELESLRGSL